MRSTAFTSRSRTWCCVVPALVIGAKVHGITGVAAAVVLVNLATGLPVLVVLMRMLRVSARELVAAIGRPAIGWALMTAALLLMLPVAHQLSSVAALALLVAVGGGLYAAGVALFARDLVRTMWLSLRGTSIDLEQFGHDQGQSPVVTRVAVSGRRRGAYIAAVASRHQLVHRRHARAERGGGRRRRRQRARDR